jgi:hypothetical protein
MPHETRSSWLAAAAVFLAAFLLMILAASPKNATCERVSSFSTDGLDGFFDMTAGAFPEGGFSFL